MIWATVNEKYTGQHRMPARRIHTSEKAERLATDRDITRARAGKLIKAIQIRRTL